MQPSNADRDIPPSPRPAIVSRQLLGGGGRDVASSWPTEYIAKECRKKRRMSTRHLWDRPDDEQEKHDEAFTVEIGMLFSIGITSELIWDFIIVKHMSTFMKVTGLLHLLQNDQFQGHVSLYIPIRNLILYI